MKRLIGAILLCALAFGVIALMVVSMREKIPELQVIESVQVEDKLGVGVGDKCRFLTKLLSIVRKDSSVIASGIFGIISDNSNAKHGIWYNISIGGGKNSSGIIDAAETRWMAAGLDRWLSISHGKEVVENEPACQTYKLVMVDSLDAILRGVGFAPDLVQHRGDDRVMFSRCVYFEMGGGIMESVPDLPGGSSQTFKRKVTPKKI